MKETSDRGQQVSIIAQKILSSYSIIIGDAPLIGRLWEYMKTQYMTEWLKDEYKDTDVLPKVNKADMAWI